VGTDDDIGSAPTIAGASTQPTPTPPTTSDDGDAPPSLLADRYELLGLVGAGGMGRVYRARDRKLEEVVALKVLRRELAERGMLERFRQEVKLARRVTNEHVVRTFDLGEHGDDHFLTMEYIDGSSLSRLLDDGALRVGEATRIARAACAGIAAAHAARVLHRDLKPDNILLARTGRIAISDFGIARATADPTATHDRFAGTPAYMAPEQVEGRDEIGPQADVYAFGAILFEMATGRRPFAGRDPIAVAVARLREPPPDPRALRALPDAFAELVLRCLARDPGARFADGAELARALDALVEPSARATTLPPIAGPAVPSRSSRAVAILPLRAPAELAEVADGLTEEIIDALTMTRALRVRPLAAVKRAEIANADARELGAALDVDIVVDGSLRRRGDTVRVAARAIGVVDGFQLWASHVDTSNDRLLEAGDEIARAVARALVVEIDVPARAVMDVALVERYLEAKARIRRAWFFVAFDEAIEQLEAVLAVAPDHAGSLATLAMALARKAFFGAGTLARAAELSARAVAVAPSSGESHLAVGITRYSENRLPEAAAAFRRALARAPGLAHAQNLLGALVLESGALDDAIAHLEAGRALDPDNPTATDLPRAYVYQGRYDEAEAILSGHSSHLDAAMFSQLQIARFRMWRGEPYDLTHLKIPSGRSYFVEYGAILLRLHGPGGVTHDDVVAYIRVNAAIPNTRLRASNSQFACEYAMAADDRELAIDCLARGVDEGLSDALWIDRCPLVVPLRSHPRFDALAEIVRSRGRAILDAVAAT
jgi:serine/threonine-protein kinase